MKPLSIVSGKNRDQEILSTLKSCVKGFQAGQGTTNLIFIGFVVRGEFSAFFLKAKNAFVIAL